jgi:hypothetical protein
MPSEHTLPDEQSFSSKQLKVEYWLSRARQKYLRNDTKG